MPLLSYWLGYAVAMSSHGLFLGVCGLGLGTGLRSTGPGLTKILGPDLQHILRQSYDYLTILQVNCIREKPCVLLKMFCKLDVYRKSIVRLALSQDNRKIVVRYYVNRSPRHRRRIVASAETNLSTLK